MIDVVGGGIGGLTLAIALQKKGITARVYEQAPEIKPVGAGITLANNGMKVYDKLGLRDEIIESGNTITSMNITNSRLKPISKIALKYIGEEHIAIHRGKLQQILVANFDKKNLILDSRLTNVKKEDAQYLLQFKNGKTVTSKVLLGADGINSMVRNCLFEKTKLRRTLQVCWRGIVDFTLPKKYHHEMNEAWGKGDRFGFMQIAANKVYWYALKSFKENQDEYAVEELSTYFKNYHQLIPALIKATSPTTIHTANISDLQPIRQWYKENVCLMGDAAHATTPNLSQGACQAIEDAYILSECLQKFKANKAFAEYQRLRISKAHQVVNRSWALGELAHWKNPLAIQFRNQVMRMIPKSVNKKQTEKIFQLETA